MVKYKCARLRCILQRRADRYRRKVMSRTAEHAIEADQSIKLNIRLDARQFGRMLFSMLKIGVIGFGGGSALIPVIEDEVV